MAVISEHIIDSVRDAVNIIDVVSRYVSLKKSGRNYMGLCPFHKEKTPSFSVHPEKQIYKCFGCGAGGNVFTFLMEHEHISFVDALKRMAEEAGIEIELKERSPEEESETERLYEANDIAQSFFQRQLKENKKVIEYLEKRGIKKESIERFKLGFAPDAWDGLLKHVQHFKYPLEIFAKLGLILEKEKAGEYYDRFRNRLMFPIHNNSGKVVGFGGRDLSGKDDIPKYINSPESPIYQKSYILYGLYFAKEAIAKLRTVIVVEGYMDWLQLFQNGVENVVATSGTSLTDDHARIIRRYTNVACVCYDSDSAGISAAVRGGEILFQNNLEVKVLLLPEGQDPDSYVAENSKEEFLELVNKSEDYFNFRLQQIQGRYDLKKALERSQAVGEILDALAPLRDNIKIDFYVERIAERWGTPATLLYNELKKKASTLRRRRRIGDEAEETKPAVEGPLTFIGAWSAEKDILILLMNYFGNISEYVSKHIDADDFLNPEFREVFSLIEENGKKIPKRLHQLVLDRIESSQLRDLFTRDLFRDFKDPVRYLHDCIRKMKIAKYKFHIDETGKKIKELDPADHLSLLQEIKRYQEELLKWQKVEIG